MEHLKLRITSCMSRLGTLTNSLVSLAIGTCNRIDGRISQSMWIAFWAPVLAALCAYGMYAPIHDELLDGITANRNFLIRLGPSPEMN